MKTPSFIWLLSLLALGGCTSAPRPQTISNHVCPNGHKATREVPIYYGFIIPDAKLRRQLDRHEALLGGCGISDDSPQSALACARCGFQLNDITMEWVRSSDDPRSFRNTISVELRDFRKVVKQKLWFTQRVEAGGGIEESTDFVSEGDPAKFRDSITAWLVSIGLTPEMRIEDRHSSWKAGDWQVDMSAFGTEVPDFKAHFVSVRHQIKISSQAPDATEADGTRITSRNFVE